jgi:hypothetical protein
VVLWGSSGVDSEAGKDSELDGVMADSSGAALNERRKGKRREGISEGRCVLDGQALGKGKERQTQIRIE